jgi:hypothetical protein
MSLILQEELRGLFYAPFYVALARDAFSAEGVEIRRRVARLAGVDPQFQARSLIRDTLTTGRR